MRREEGPPYQVAGLYLYIDTDEGLSGLFGPVSAEEARIITGALAPVLLGENPHAVERLWDRMYRTAIHGRKGQTMMAISKVDLALWDLKAKAGAPCRAAGGPTRAPTAPTRRCWLLDRSGRCGGGAEAVSRLCATKVRAQGQAMRAASATTWR